MNFNLERIARAIEADAGQELPEIRQALAEAKAGLGRITKPEHLLHTQEELLYPNHYGAAWAAQPFKTRTSSNLN